VHTVTVMPPVAKKVGDTDESYSWVDAVKAPAGASRYKNGPQYVDPRKVLVQRHRIRPRRWMRFVTLSAVFPSSRPQSV
jgi:hypothetical protein